MNVWSLINEGVALFNNKKFDEAIEKLNQALDGIEDKNNQIQEQNDIKFFLGRCSFEQAMKAKGKESEQLFGQAVEHFQQQLRLVSDKINDKADDNDPVDGNKVSLMRIGSSTYMNDPTEGEGLLELLNLQDLELENKADCPAYNAFFT